MKRKSYYIDNCWAGKVITNNKRPAVYRLTGIQAIAFTMAGYRVDNTYSYEDYLYRHPRKEELGRILKQKGF
jgi:hypothetical protein